MTYPFKNIALNRNRKIVAVANPSADITQMVAKAVPGVADNYRGVWDTSGTYTNGEMVLYSNVVWLCLASTTTATPATGSTVWQAIGSYSAFLGTWSSSTAYVVGDEVTYGGNFYFCTTANTNQTPSTSSSYWQIAGPVSLANVADDPAGTWRKVGGVGTGNLIGFKSLVGDTSGDNTTSLVDTNTKSFLHNAMSTGVKGVISSGSQLNVNPTGGVTSTLPYANHDTSFRNVISSGSQLTVNPTGGVTGNLPYANHDVSVRTTLGATAGGDGSYLNTSQVFNRHLNQATQSGLADDAIYQRWKVSQQTAVLANPSQGHVLDPTFTSVADFWNNVGSASSGVFTLPSMTANQGLGPGAYNMDGRGIQRQIKVQPGDVVVMQISCVTAATGTVATNWVALFVNSAGADLGVYSVATAGASGTTTIGAAKLAPASAVGMRIYFQGNSGVSGGNNASVSNPVVRINQETVIDTNANKAFVDFTNNVSGGHIGKVLTNIADDATYTKTLASVQTGNVPDLSKGILGKSLANIADDSGSSRYAVLAVDTNRRAVIDFTQSAHIGKTQSNVADDATYLRWKASQQTAVLGNPGPNHVLDPSFTSIADFWGNVDSASAGVLNQGTVAASGYSTNYNYDGRGNPVKVKLDPGDTLVLQLTSTQAPTGTASTYLAADFQTAAGAHISYANAAYVPSTGTGTGTSVTTAPATCAYAYLYIQTFGGASGGNAALVTSPQARINHETVADAGAKKAYIDFTDNTSGGHVGKTQSNVADDSNAKMLRFGTLASRPAAGTAGRIYHASDAGTNGITYRDTGSAWVGMAVGHLADINGTLDNTNDGSSRFAVAAVDPNKKALIDFSQPGHSNANIQYFGGIQSGTCYDGQAITFNPAYASIPLVIFSGGGMSYSSVTGSATTQSQAFTASSLTTSGFTASLKLVSGGTLTARTDTFTTVTSGSEYQATLTNAPAYNNTYTVNWVLSLNSASEGTVYIRETNSSGTILFQKTYLPGQNGAKSTPVIWSGATGTSVVDISLVLSAGSGTIGPTTVTFTSGTAPSSVSAVPSTAPITWVAFPQT